ncbi:hypothetical protein EPN87_01220 [archaeon]|nr:MAG: hypothetical protein EPN87_01220 [archaeon]
MLTDVVLMMALLAGILSIALFTFTIFFEKNKRRSKILLVWATLFLAAAFVAIEYASWINGYFLFNIIPQFNFPLLAYFGIWFVFVAWLFESIGERKVWLILLATLLIVTVIALNCPNCVRF